METAVRKPNLPGFLSFPLGFEMIESALSGCKVADALQLHWSEHDCTFASDFHALLRDQSPHRVLSCHFTRWDNAPARSSTGWCERFMSGAWDLWVYPTARTWRKSVRDLLAVQGLPAVRQWIDSDRPDSWYWGRMILDMRYDPQTQELVLDDRTDKV
jgi:hypothetical protein